MVGIDGWLLLVAVGIVLSPIRATYGAVTGVIHPLFSNPELFLPTSPMFRPRLAGFVWFELVGNIIQVALFLWLAWSFFKKLRYVPTLFCAALTFTATLHLVDGLLLKFLFPASALAGNWTASMGPMLLSCAIWIPYFLLSERVKNTFVR